MIGRDIQALANELEDMIYYELFDLGGAKRAKEGESTIAQLIAERINDFVEEKCNKCWE